MLTMYEVILKNAYTYIITRCTPFIPACILWLCAFYTLSNGKVTPHDENDNKERKQDYAATLYHGHMLGFALSVT